MKIDEVTLVKDGLNRLLSDSDNAERLANLVLALLGGYATDTDRLEAKRIAEDILDRR